MVYPKEQYNIIIIICIKITLLSSFFPFLTSFNLYFTQPAPALKLQDLATWKYHVGPIPIKIYNPPKIAENPKIGRIILSDKFTSLLLIFERV